MIAHMGPVISANGEYVVFESFASDLVSGISDDPGGDNDGTEDVFIRNLQTGVTQMVSVNPSGTAAGNQPFFSVHIKALPAVSADGNDVLFTSMAFNLDAGVFNNTNAGVVFLRDMQTGVTQMVSVTSAGTPAEISPQKATTSGTPPFQLTVFSAPLLSSDGKFALFVSDTSNVVAGMNDSSGGTNVYLRNLATHTTELVSVNAAGTGTGDGPSADFLPTAMSGDGRFVAFWSSATNLVPGLTTSGTNLFIRDMQLGRTSLVAVANNSTGGAPSSGAAPAFSGDDRFLTFANGSGQVYLYGVSSGTTRLISYAPDGTPSNGASTGPVMSADGSTIVFISQATNLAPGTGQNGGDLFLYHSAVVPLSQFEFSAPVFTGGTENGSATVTIERVLGTQGTATVHIATSNGTATAGLNYTAVSEDVTFPSGVATETVQIPLIDDTRLEGTDTVNLALTSASGVLLGQQRTSVLQFVNNEVTGRFVDRSNEVSKPGGNVYNYTAPADGVLTLLLSSQTAGANLSLSVSDLQRQLKEFLRRHGQRAHRLPRDGRDRLPGERDGFSNRDGI